MREERLNQIAGARRTVKEIVYGYDAKADEVIVVQGAEIEEMVRGLLALLDRNRRMATAVLSGNSRALYREYAKQWDASDGEWT